MPRQLLIGCGYPLHGGTSTLRSGQRPYRMTLRVHGAVDTWDQLTTLDINPDVDPDLKCDLNGHIPWLAQPLGKDAFYELEGDYWDEIHAYEVLEHLGRQGDALSFFAHFSEIWRLLKPGGHLLASVPSKRSGFFWGDPSHSRAILPESLVFLDQNEYVKQCDGPVPTAMSDFRSIYKADFRQVEAHDSGTNFYFILQAVKPSRWKPRA
jgi:SAM-dependent methyltransferase